MCVCVYIRSYLRVFGEPRDRNTRRRRACVCAKMEMQDRAHGTTEHNGGNRVEPTEEDQSAQLRGFPIVGVCVWVHACVRMDKTITYKYATNLRKPIRHKYINRSAALNAHYYRHRYNKPGTGGGQMVDQARARGARQPIRRRTHWHPKTIIYCLINRTGEYAINYRLSL